MAMANHPDGLRCNFYCCPPRHAVGALVDPPASPASILADVRGYFLAKGWVALEARPAREADLPEWRQHCTRRLHPDGTSEPYATADAAAEPWLIIVEALPHGDY